MAFKLTKSGAKDIKSEDLDIPPRNPLPVQSEPERAPKKDPVRDWNNKPEVREAGVMAVSRATYYGLWAFAVILVLLVATHVVWSNLNVSSGKMQGNTTLINNVAAPTVPVTVNDADTNYYNLTATMPVQSNVTVNIDIGDEIAQQIANEAIKIIKNQTNSTA